MGRLQLHGVIYRPDSFVLTLRYCVNYKAIRCESTSLNRIVADESHRVIVAVYFTVHQCLTEFDALLVLLLKTQLMQHLVFNFFMIVHIFPTDELIFFAITWIVIAFFCKH